MSNIKELIKERLNQLNKEELVDALADVCAIYVSANIITQLSSANCIQQSINNVQTNLQQVDNVLSQRLNINLKKL
jgi:predicted transcriptional regulator